MAKEEKEPARIRTRTIRQKVEFGASPHEVYEALMDQRKHSKFTGSPAKISREAGGEFTAYDDSIRGRNIELIPDKLIVQDWFCETDGWPEGHFSRVSIMLRQKPRGGCVLDFRQAGVPVAAYDEISEGWKEYYWEPMKKMLGGG